MPRLAPSSGSRRGAGDPSSRGGSGSAATSGVAAALRGLGVRPSRRLGQNFLSDPRVSKRIATLVDDPAEQVLEIGPGLGALTLLLAQTGRQLVAVEIDFRLAEALERKLEPYPGARVVRGDILDQRIAALFSGGARTAVTVVGNLPYSITTPTIEWLLRQGESVRRGFFMVQREYAVRLTASPGGKDYGSISVFVGLHAEVASLFRVSSGAFYPRPEVDSMVLELTPRPYPGATGEDRRLAERLARAGMGTRRKTVANSLARRMEIGSAAAREILERAGIDPERRAETLSIDEWVRLARGFPGQGFRTQAEDS